VENMAVAGLFLGGGMENGKPCDIKYSINNGGLILAGSCDEKHLEKMYDYITENIKAQPQKKKY